MIKNRREKRRREPVIIFSNTLIHTPPCPLLKKPFLLSKCQRSKHQKVRCGRVSVLDMYVKLSMREAK